MLTQHQIMRDIENERYAALITRIQANGRCAAAGQVLGDPAVVRTSAMGLAVLRLCEMTHGRAESLPGMAAALIELQHESGLFADSHTKIDDPEHREAVIAATAIATAALRLMAAMSGRVSARGDGASGRKLDSIVNAAERGLGALRRLRNSTSLCDARQGWLLAKIHLPDVAGLHVPLEPSPQRTAKVMRHGRGHVEGPMRRSGHDEAELALARYARAVAA